MIRFLDFQALWVITLTVGGLMVIGVFNLLINEALATSRIPMDGSTAAYQMSYQTAQHIAGDDVGGY